jgi:uncharacterized membrane protein YeaQ/YmgE (transglycosylase-associated protein family)
MVVAFIGAVVVLFILRLFNAGRAARGRPTWG